MFLVFLPPIPLFFFLPGKTPVVQGAKGRICPQNGGWGGSIGRRVAEWVVVVQGGDVSYLRLFVINLNTLRELFWRSFESSFLNPFQKKKLKKPIPIGTPNARGENSRSTPGASAKTEVPFSGGLNHACCRNGTVGSGTAGRPVD